jgi:predicted lactoylglutathione lyase
MIQANSLKSGLGDIAAFTISSPDLEVSLRFYQQLGFKEVMRSGFPFPLIQISDDAILIMLRKSSDPYIALTYYLKDQDSVIPDLEKKKIQFISRPQKNDFIKRYVFQSPDETNISLVVMPEEFKKPAGKTMLTMAQDDYFNPEAYTNKVAGMFGEFAQPVDDLEKSIEFWQKIGFTILSKFESPYPWAILSDGLAVVGLHQSNHFDSPTITFFASDMENKIDHLKEKQLEYKELSPGNIALTTPEQQKIFLFKMGM